MHICCFDKRQNFLESKAFHEFKEQTHYTGKKPVYYVMEAQESAAAETKAHLQFRKLGTGLQGRIHLVKPLA